ASTTPKSTKMLLEPVRLLKLTQTTDVASGYILDGLTVQSKVTFLNGLTRGSRSCGSCEEVVVKLQSPHARAQSHQGRRANKGFLPVDLCDLGSYACGMTPFINSFSRLLEPFVSLLCPKGGRPKPVDSYVLRSDSSNRRPRHKRTWHFWDPFRIQLESVG